MRRRERSTSRGRSVACEPLHLPGVRRLPDAGVAAGDAADDVLRVRRERRHWRGACRSCLRPCSDGILADELAIEGVHQQQLRGGPDQQILAARAELHKARQDVVPPDVGRQVETSELTLRKVPRVEEVDLGPPHASREDQALLVKARDRGPLAVDLGGGLLDPQVPQHDRLILGSRQEHILVRVRADGQRAASVSTEEAQVFVLVEIPILHHMLRLTSRSRHRAVLVIVQEFYQAATVLLTSEMPRSLGSLARVDEDAVVLAARHEMQPIISEVHSCHAAALVVAEDLAHSQALDQRI
mmetsp:Transcript_14627/g.37875  ORF Transcript_14627/g.37875 Transcript_14627/m.37875 type:complete len:299 (-) Transcript_14627:168-1064(-)